MADYMNQPDKRWTLVLNGEVYCSPACGCKCTKEAYDSAVRAGAELCLSMGAGWEPRIWENGGWHYEARKGNSHVGYDRKEGTYNAWLQPQTHVGTCSTQFIVYGEKTPQAALAKAVSDCHTHIDVCNAEIALLAS